MIFALPTFLGVIVRLLTETTSSLSERTIKSSMISLGSAFSTEISSSIFLLASPIFQPLFKSSRFVTFISVTIGNFSSGIEDEDEEEDELEVDEFDDEDELDDEDEDDEEELDDEDEDEDELDDEEEDEVELEVLELDELEEELEELVEDEELSVALDVLLDVIKLQLAKTPPEIILDNATKDNNFNFFIVCPFFLL